MMLIICLRIHYFFKVKYTSNLFKKKYFFGALNCKNLLQSKICRQWNALDINCLTVYG